MTAMAIDKPRGRAWWKELWIQVLIAMAAGIALGIVNPEAGAKMQPLGDAFIKAIRMLIAPIIFCTVVHGIAQHGRHGAGRARRASRRIIYFEVMTTIALIIGLIAVNVLQARRRHEHRSRQHRYASAVEPYVKQTARDRLRAVPDEHHSRDLHRRLCRGQFLQVLFISVLCGFALMQLGERAGAAGRSDRHRRARCSSRVVGFVMWAAPIGAFGAIAFTVGKFGVGSLASLGKLLGGFYLTCLIFIFVRARPGRAVLRLQAAQADPLHPGRAADRASPPHRRRRCCRA